MILRYLIQSTLWGFFMAALLFVPAGTLDWPGAWVFLIEMTVGGVGLMVWLGRHDPALLAERMKSPIQREQKGWDKLFMGGFVLLWLGWLAFMGFDHGGFDHGGPDHAAMPVWLEALGGLGLPIAIYGGYLTFRENSFAAPVVKIQAARGQTVISTGPYSHVRHPMYAGALFYLVGMPLLLGSWHGLIFSPFLILLLAGRTVMEERTLRAELAGYDAYAARVRYRLIPHVW